MKKLLVVLTSALIFVATMYSFDGGFDIKCYACKEREMKKEGHCHGCRAWRMYDQDLTTDYYVYHCEHGHILHIPKTDSKKLSDITVYDPETKTYRNLDDNYLERYKINGYE